MSIKKIKVSMIFHDRQILKHWSRDTQLKESEWPSKFPGNLSKLSDFFFFYFIVRTIMAKRAPQVAQWVKNACNAGDAGKCQFDPWVEKIPGKGHDIPPQDSCLENVKDRGAWKTIVHRVESRTWLKQLSMHARIMAKREIDVCSAVPALSQLKTTWK